MTSIDYLKSWGYWAVLVVALIVFLHWIQKLEKTAKKGSYDLLQREFRLSLSNSGITGEVLLDDTSYYDGKIFSWRIIKDSTGAYFSFRATLYGEQFVEHSIQKVSVRDLRRWLFWRPNFYKKVFERLEN
jgi:hypothetical protein